MRLTIALKTLTVLARGQTPDDRFKDILSIGELKASIEKAHGTCPRRWSAPVSTR